MIKNIEVKDMLTALGTSLLALLILDLMTDPNTKKRARH